MMIVSDACDKFLSHCMTTVNLSAHTLRAYRGDLTSAQTYLGEAIDLSTITKENLRKYIQHMREEKRHKDSSIKRRIACLKLLFRWALHEEVLTTNPFETLNERIRLPRRLPRALDRNHANTLKKTVSCTTKGDSFDAICSKTAVHVLLEAGLRVGELTSIRVEDISISDRRIKVHGKGNRQRIVYFLSPQLNRSIRLYLSKRGKVVTTIDKLFITESGRELTPQQVRIQLRDLATSAGIDRHITPHMLRHTCATQWLESGLDIRFVQKLLGHYSISTTEIYTHVSDQGLLEALLKARGGKCDN